ncbi:DUF6414 family protein [Cellulosimicrobium aquatile]|uniref:DUF6414 family protein n=1 Tax=Cellulosimicrobium aquatile TaxID=1612203 RepID=UPI001459395E|nr:hypothetical protein [Cellulosimicrobium aquatile]NMF29609.1 hypothetical protein [Cellulosimicrobium aquatile]
MPIRQPVYLDLDLLQNTADYLEIGYPVDAEVRERGTRDRGAGASVKVPGVPIGAEAKKGSSEEVETTYSVAVRPVRVMNDTIDAAIREGLVKDVDGSGIEHGVSRRDLVQVTGELRLSPVSELGELLSRLLPVMLPMVAAQGDQGVPPEAVSAIMTGGDDEARPLLFRMDVDQLEHPIFVHVDPNWFHRSAGPDDLAAELTVFGVLDQIAAEHKRLDTSRYVLPNLNRAARRSMSADSIDDLLTKFKHDPADAVVEGPYWFVKPVAVF